MKKEKMNKDELKVVNVEEVTKYKKYPKPKDAVSGLADLFPIKQKRDKIEEFLQNYKSKATRQTYRSLIKKYFDTINKNPNTYFKGKQNYENDIKGFLQAINKSPPKTIRGSLAAVKSFLEENDIELTRKFWKKQQGRIQGKRAWTEENVPTVEQLQKILTHANSLQRSFILTLVSSGMRIGELLQIKLNDIDLTKNPAHINLRGEYTKSGERRDVFISSEAVTAVNEWLKVRDKYLVTACGRIKALDRHLGRGVTKTTNDSRLFPVGDETVRQMWNRLLDKAGLGAVDERTKIHKMHLHTIRKFFRSRMPKAIGVDITETLMGHEGYLTGEYRRYSYDVLAEEYLKGVSLVSVFEVTPDLSEVHSELKKKDIQIQELKDQMSMLMARVLTSDDKEKKKD